MADGEVEPVRRKEGKDYPGYMDRPRGKQSRHNGHGRYTVDSAERDAQAARLRAGGWSFAQIGVHMGCSAVTASRMVQRALDQVLIPEVGELRKIECATLDHVQEKLLATINNPPPKLDIKGVPTSVPDADAATRASDVLIRLQARRAKLLGLDVPPVSVVVARKGEELDREIAGLEERLREQAREQLLLDLRAEGRLLDGRVEPGGAESPPAGAEPPA